MTWPIVLREDLDPPGAIGRVLLRPLRRSDGPAWDYLRQSNAEWLAPWEPTDPATSDDRYRSATWSRPPSFASYVRELNRQGRRGHAVPLAIDVDGELAGQITAGNLVYGSQRSAIVGYWVGQHVAGQGIAPLAAAMVIDHLLDGLRLHRVEICIRPDNIASRRAVAKLDLRLEGARERFVHINGQWRDHLVYAIDASEWAGPGEMVRRWRQWHATARSQQGENYNDVI